MKNDDLFPDGLDERELRRRLRIAADERRRLERIERQLNALDEVTAIYTPTGHDCGLLARTFGECPVGICNGRRRRRLLREQRRL